MASTQDTKCPSCGIESGPCAVMNGMSQYHVERLKASNPKTYEHPDCEECRERKDAMVDASYSYRGYRPDVGTYQSKSRWPKGYREESVRLERASNLASARFHFHLGSEHKDEYHTKNLPKYLTIIMREGRLEP
ncbi:MAG TPA: hypothetical protein VIH72_09245 [Candidatus Acidoferrales bacterium]